MDADKRPSGLRFLENLAYLVPGYAGYKTRDRRQEEDSRLRARVFEKLGELRHALEQIQTRWVEEEAGAQVEQLERRQIRLRTIADAVRYSPYAGREFFVSEVLGEQLLDQVLEADLLILEDLDQTESYLERACLSVTPAPRTARAFFRALDEEFGQLERHLIMREKILSSA